jgi:hypothetical protein
MLAARNAGSIFLDYVGTGLQFYPCNLLDWAVKIRIFLLPHIGLVGKTYAGWRALL